MSTALDSRTAVRWAFVRCSGFRQAQTALLAFTLLLASSLPLWGAGSPQRGGNTNLALFPFSGGESFADGEALVSSLARQKALHNAFAKTTLLSSSAQDALRGEEDFQRNGLTDPDSILELGKREGASHVMAGYITELRDQKLVIVEILDVESLQMISGGYWGFDQIEEVDKLLPRIARELARLASRDTANLPGISVPPFATRNEIENGEAQVLAHILSCELVKAGKYAVLPRTDSVDVVIAEHKRQREGGIDSERVSRLGAGRNARFVLAGSVQKLGSLKKMGSDVLSIDDGSHIAGYEVPYQDLDDGIALMKKFVPSLNRLAPQLQKKLEAIAVLEEEARNKREEERVAEEARRAAVIVEERKAQERREAEVRLATAQEAARKAEADARRAEEERLAQELALKVAEEHRILKEAEARKAEEERRIWEARAQTENEAKAKAEAEKAAEEARREVIRLEAEKSRANENAASASAAAAKAKLEAVRLEHERVRLAAKQASEERLAGEKRIEAEEAARKRAEQERLAQNARSAALHAEAELERTRSSGNANTGGLQ